MTALQFIRESGVCTTKELMEFSKAYPKDMADLKQWAIEEMKNKRIEVTEASITN